MCLRDVPDYMKDNTVKFDYYLKETMKSESILFFSK